jgi:hypothetical protein
MDAEGSSEESAVTASGAWLRHYKTAARRRRAAGVQRFTRGELKRRRLREVLKLAASTVGVFLLAGVFYLLLSR